MDYLNDLHGIEKVLLALDRTAYDTIEDANNCLIKYDSLKDDVISIIKQVIENFSISITTKESVSNEAIRILTNHIGNADDIQKYGNILESFHHEGKLTKQQLSSFSDNLDIGRWR
jgi:Na+/phosphate symporter